MKNKWKVKKCSYLNLSYKEIRLLQKTNNVQVTEACVNTVIVSVGPCRTHLSLNLTQEVHSHFLHTWRTLTSTQREHMLLSGYTLLENTVRPCLQCSLTCDWTRTDCSHPVSGPGFISSCSTVEHLTFARKHWGKTSQPDRHPVRQEAIQRRS